MFDYLQQLREVTLETSEGKPEQERADALNLIEMIITGGHSVEEIVQAIGDGTVPVVYKPRGIGNSHSRKLIGEKTEG